MIKIHQSTTNLASPPFDSIPPLFPSLSSWFQDRHNGNILLDTEGHLIHIDFGFIFGDDPKKKFVNPPPFRITNSMVVAMGGQEGKYFKQFCKV